MIHMEECGPSAGRAGMRRCGAAGSRQQAAPVHNTMPCPQGGQGRAGSMAQAAPTQNTMPSPWYASKNLTRYRAYLVVVAAVVTS